MVRKVFDVTTSDKDILKREILRQIVYTRAEELMVGKNALPMQTMDALEIKMALPKVTRFDPEEIAEGALAGYQMLEWFETTNVMKKEQVRILVTDEAKARMQADIQTRTSVEAAARGLAWSKDTDIFSVLHNGAAHSIAAASHWHVTDAKPQYDIAAAIDTMLTGTYMTESDLANVKVFYPIGLYGYLVKPLGEGYMPGQTTKGFIESTYNVTFYPTRQLTTTAFVVINSPETGMHITYSGSAIPTSEEQRLPGVGNQYILTQYYKTFVMPEAENGTTNHRIYEITGVT